MEIAIAFLTCNDLPMAIRHHLQLLWFELGPRVAEIEASVPESETETENFVFDVEDH